MLMVASPALSGMSAPKIEVGSADQDDERVAEALILRGEHQEDHHQREDEGVDQRAAFLHELPALSLEVVEEALWKALRLIL